MAKQSAGLLLYRFSNAELQVLLVHPGGPFWAKKDLGAWSIPKGEFAAGEQALAAAIREVKEEMGVDVGGTFLPLTNVKQKSGKIIYAWALQAEVDTAAIVSNTFDMEWPPHSGKIIQVPEVDKAGWFTVQEACQKINPAQVALIEELVRLLS